MRAGGLVLLLCVAGVSSLCDTASKYQHYSPILCPIAKFRVCWNVTSTHLVMEMEAKATGWLGIGFMSTSLQGVADVVIGFIEHPSLQPHVLDYKTTYGSQTHSPPVLDASQDVELVSASQKDVSQAGYTPGVYTEIVFKRLWDTSDTEGDYPIDHNNPTGIIWAVGYEQTSSPVMVNGNWSIPTHVPSSTNGNKGWWANVDLTNGQAVLTCTYYCEQSATSCGDYQSSEGEWDTPQECLDNCARYLKSGAWTLGDLQSTAADNTLACRVHQAQSAQSTPEDRDDLRLQLCQQSGVSGAGYCGSYCENLCAYLRTGCSDIASGPFSPANCLETCSALPNGTATTTTTAAGVNVTTLPAYGLPNYPFYDTVQCRVMQAAVTLPTTTAVSCGEATLASCGSLSDVSFSNPSCSAACSDVTATPSCLYFCEKYSDVCYGAASPLGGSTPSETAYFCNNWCLAQVLEEGLQYGSLNPSYTQEGYSVACLLSLVQTASSPSHCSHILSRPYPCNATLPELTPRNHTTTPSPTTPAPATGSPAPTAGPVGGSPAPTANNSDTPTPTTRVMNGEPVRFGVVSVWVVLWYALCAVLWV